MASLHGLSVIREESLLPLMVMLVIKLSTLFNTRTTGSAFNLQRSSNRLLPFRPRLSSFLTCKTKNCEHARKVSVDEDNEVGMAVVHELS